MMTCFKDSPKELFDEFHYIIQDMRNNELSPWNLNERISEIQSRLDLNENEEFLESVLEIRDNAEKALSSIERRQFFINQTANLFYGLSLGSILLLAALGLAITFGLMGVINMAHGEMLMIGAYATFLIQIFSRNIYLIFLTGILLPLYQRRSL